MNIRALKYINLLYGFFLMMALFSCGKREKRFELISAEKSGIDFQNNLVATPQMNIFTYLYFYNGGGVAAGDLNGDSLPDLYFTSNLESNKLYLNKGDFKFQDITETARVAGKKGWTSGVTMADVNGDGKLDIYVSQLGDYKNIWGKNQLYINLGNDENGVPVFEDQAHQYGLDLVGFSTQAAFFDYDLDGDLDMYMLNHSVHANGTFGKASLRLEKHPLAGDKLMRNDGGKFTDVTDQAGIYSSVLGYGLGISIGDLNWDGYPDIYVGNDFHEDDYLYINNGNGTFTEKLAEYIEHTSKSSMGNDVGDINNDGYEDIISLDMLPADPVGLKTAEGEDPYDLYNYKLSYGYKDQLARNTLQLNLGNGKFSEIALLSGVYATDWSWSALMADLNLDGYKDIFIGNGVKRRSNDMDYIKFISDEVIQHRLEGDLTAEDLALVEKMPIVKIPNYVFENNGDLTFEDVSARWGFNQSSLSNGATYADLDNDGDLDIVTNNIDEKAFVYRNNTISGDHAENHFLKIDFKGKGANPFGIGAKVIAQFPDGKIINESFTTRGFQSAVPNEIIIGLGQKEKVDELTIIWPDLSFQKLKDVKADQRLIVNQNNARGTYTFLQAINPLFQDVTNEFVIPYKHEENKFIEYNREALIPHMASTEGPKLATGDVNGDGLEDFYIGGAKWQSGELYLQTSSGFSRQVQPAFKEDSLAEDIDAEFVDVDNDGDADLVIASGGNEFRLSSEPMLVRLYKNDGKGNFERDRKDIPDIYVNASCIKSTDFDNDGDQDIFVGGRVVPWSYGETPQSYLLLNDGKGHFEDATTKAGGEELAKAGMVKDAIWVDIDGDKDQDLILVGEWMPVTVFLNENNKLVHASEKDLGLENSNGWWNRVAAEDVDGDGDMDIIAGNLGLNSKLKASREKPLEMYVADFDGNGSVDPLLFYYINGKKLLFPTKDEVDKQFKGWKTKFASYDDFAKADAQQVVSHEQLKKANLLNAFEMRSGVFINDGNMKFSFHPFPVSAQFSPINSFYKTDFDHDGKIDLLAGGNFYEVNIQRGRCDASFGILLKNSGNGSFEEIPNRESGILIEGQVRDIASVIKGDSTLILIAKNKAPIQFIIQSTKPQ